MTSTAMSPRATTQQEPSGPSLRPRRRRGDRMPYWLVLPSVVVIAAVLAYPLFQLLSLSLQQYRLKELLKGKGEFIGLKNYQAILTDPFFWQVVLRSVLFTAVAVTATIGIGTGIALLMRRMNRAMRIALNVVLILVWAIPGLVSIVVFQWMVDFEFGVVNYLLTKLGLDFDKHNWFENPVQGFAVIAALVVWGALPFVVITLYAGLTQVPRELEEAAMVDGATGRQVFWNVTMPVLRPVYVILTSLSVIWDFMVFQQIWVMLNGRPTPDYYTIGVYSFVQSFGVNDYGKGSAIAVIMVLMLLSVTWIYIRQMVKIGEVK
ncbi:MAG TPA: sugar ABC transporter permease [Candidatus Nanopelagicales bacterium]|nr:sugar ABC transporter permease [Candidatus Nanopelagicales bacterium]